MRIFVTGEQGQLARCLAEANDGKHQVVFGARPTFDLTRPENARDQVVAAKPEIIVNAAAYTAVDKAESERELAFAVNRDGARAMADAARVLNVPIIHISTDYVFTGEKTSPYVEDDATGPVGVYGQSKLAGEETIRNATSKHVILRTSWVYSVYGANFLKTMLRVGKDRPELRVVDDQIGNPTSAHDLAAVVIKIAEAVGGGRGSYGTFHAAGQGDVTWCGFARGIFDAAAKTGIAVPKVAAITTADYPTPAKRPANSRLNCEKLATAYGIRLPHWSGSTQECVQRLMLTAEQAA
jgi:dTDP-4-dehydrorhamnose reductase